MTSEQEGSHYPWPASDVEGQDNPYGLYDDVSSEDGDLATPETDSDLDGWVRPSLVNREAMERITRQLSPILIPLPFALLIFLFTLPFTLKGPPAHPPIMAMGILLLALALLQGVLLYFAGSNDGLWLLYIFCGYALFLISGAFAVFGIPGALVTLAILLLIGGFMAQRGIRPTPEGYVDIVESLGKYSHTLYPGLNFLMPWEKSVARLNTQENFWDTPMQHVPLSREQDVHFVATVSYQLVPEDAYLTLSVKDWEAGLQALFVGTAQSVVNDLPPSDLITWSQSAYARSNTELHLADAMAATRWDRINTSLARRIQDRVASWGVQINWVRLHDITMVPRAGGPLPAMPTSPLAQPRSADTSAPRNSTPPSVPKLEIPARLESAPAAPPPLAPPAIPPSPPIKASSINIETLVETYEAVRRGVITDPTTITDAARRFEILANDQELNKTINFDATRAAQTLYQRAKKYEAQAQKAASAPPPQPAQSSAPTPDAVTVAVPERSSSDDPLTRGG